MKTLLLVRHAKSSWKDPSLADRDRPLNKRGKRDAPRMGKRLAARGVLPEIIISSPAVRARKTANKIASQIGYPKDRIHIEEGLYQGGSTGMLTVIRGIDDKARSAMLFGHNPGTTDLLNYLAHAEIPNVPTCGIAELRFVTDSWSEVVSGGGRLVDFDYPKRVDD